MRIPAKRMPIREITSGKFVETEGQWESNYILTKNSENVSRVAIYGVIVSKYSNIAKEFCSVTVEDLTDDIRVSGFKGMAKKLENFRKGDVVLVVGRLRKDLKENIYVFPEIVRKIEADEFFLNVFENY
ncbi:OB-fold nucleic acid binding domain-containing protein [Methanococcus sp. CF]